MDQDNEETENEGSEGEDDLSVNKNLFAQAVMWGTDWTVETVLSQLKKGNIDLNPRFQRRNAWSFKRKSKLIESILLGLPIPEIVLAEVKGKKGEYIIIDGKQRLLSMRQFCADKDDEAFKNFRLSGLKVLMDLNGKKYKDLISNPEYHEYKTAFENQTIRTIVIRNWPNDDFLYSVFLRINTGSVQLSPQELRQALRPGPFLDFVDDCSEKNELIRRVLHLDEPDPRMRDVELIIRFIAYYNYRVNYKGNLKGFLDMTCETLNKTWNENETQIKAQVQELNRAIETTIEIFGERDAFSKWINDGFQQKFNRAVYDVMVHYFAYPMVREAIAEKKAQVREEFIRLCVHDQAFLKAFETTTKNLTNTNKRFSTWEEALSRITGLDISRIVLEQKKALA